MLLLLGALLGATAGAPSLLGTRAGSKNDGLAARTESVVATATEWRVLGFAGVSSAIGRGETAEKGYLYPFVLGAGRPALWMTGLP